MIGSAAPVMFTIAGGIVLAYLGIIVIFGTANAIVALVVELSRACSREPPHDSVTDAFNASRNRNDETEMF